MAENKWPVTRISGVVSPLFLVRSLLIWPYLGSLVYTKSLNLNVSAILGPKHSLTKLTYLFWRVTTVLGGVFGRYNRVFLEGPTLQQIQGAGSCHELLATEPILPTRTRCQWKWWGAMLILWVFFKEAKNTLEMEMTQNFQKKIPWKKGIEEKKGAFLYKHTF